MSKNLQQQVDEKRMQIHTSGYPMSIGELANMYRDGELEIHPAFQRFFRWNETQKSKLIDSLLLGIPIPSVFVYMDDDGVWTVVDGVQRLSTIFEFMGILKDKDGQILPPSTLVGTEYLPGLQGIRWGSGDEEDAVNCLSLEQQRIIKRAFLDIKIINRESDKNAQYDLFERLNTGGAKLSDQEVRNALLVMENSDFFDWIVRLKEEDDFKSCLTITDRQIDEQYDTELIMRFIILSRVTKKELNKIGDISDYLTKKSIELAGNENFDADKVDKEFKDVFRILNKVLGENAFRRFDLNKGKFLGPHILSAYETITCGLAANLEYWLNIIDIEGSEDILKNRVQNLWAENLYRENSGNGIRANIRLKRTIPFGREFFGDNYGSKN